MEITGIQIWLRLGAQFVPMVLNVTNGTCMIVFLFFVLFSKYDQWRELLVPISHNDKNF